MAVFQPIARSFSSPQSEPAKSSEIRERQICVPDVSVIPFIHNPRFAELISTNDSPQPTDLPFLNTSLESALSISSWLNEGILTIQRALEELESAKTAVLTAITQHQGILSTVRWIPDDVILTIFQWCSSMTHGDSLSSSHAPWTLSQVSRRWRNLSISSPCLWSNAYIRNIDTPNPQERERMAFKLNLYLHRSAECDLHLLFCCQLKPVFFAECLPLLQRTAYRWKSLNLQVYDPTCATFISRLSQCRSDRLTHMDVSFWCEIPDDYCSIWDVPNVRDLKLRGFGSEMVDMAWAGITKYVCDEHGLCHLPKLVAVEDLSLNVYAFEKALEILTSMGVSLPMTLPNVRSISMSQVTSVQAIDKLSDLFLVPSLTTLTIKVAYPGWKFPSFNGSIHHLRNLSIVPRKTHASWLEKFHVDKPALRSFLGECTSVTALFLHMSDPEEDVLRTIADECVLPKLTSLRVQVQAMWDDPGTVLHLLESRCQSVEVARLTEFRIVEAENSRMRGMWMQSKAVTEGISERWNAIYSKMNVFTVFENDF